MRQVCEEAEMPKEARGVDEGGGQMEDLQREIRGDLYDETLDISEEGRREKVDDLRGKMVDFSDVVLQGGKDLARLEVGRDLGLAGDLWGGFGPPGGGVGGQVFGAVSSAFGMILGVGIGRREGFDAMTGREAISAQDNFFGVAIGVAIGVAGGVNGSEVFEVDFD
ncbi:hypothetical protein G7Y79_00023g054810 [Physcia stellaris]|nr:hypothetical protein G7Y79_00023g054810 [Physcia stellaris]